MCSRKGEQIVFDKDKFQKAIDRFEKARTRLTNLLDEFRKIFHLLSGEIYQTTLTEEEKDD